MHYIDLYYCRLLSIDYKNFTKRPYAMTVRIFLPVKQDNLLRPVIPTIFYQYHEGGDLPPHDIT